VVRAERSQARKPDLRKRDEPQTRATPSFHHSSLALPNTSAQFAESRNLFASLNQAGVIVDVTTIPGRTWA